MASELLTIFLLMQKGRIFFFLSLKILSLEDLFSFLLEDSFS